MPTRSRSRSSRGGPWAAARGLAEQTPESRNRYVDFLRALSIGAVVFGHWLIAAPSFVDGRIQVGHMLSISPWTQWLSWGFQVMPVFFIVGGYSNAASWGAALRNRQPFRLWLGARLRRLVGPLLPLVAVWGVVGLAAHQFDVRPAIIKFGSQAALVPTWFLAVYVLVAVFVPLTYAAWQRSGIASFWALAVAAVAVDVVSLQMGPRAIGWVNYLFVWLAVHQLGYLWRDGRLAGAKRALPWAAGGLVTLVALVTVAGYPRSMVGVPGEEISNTLPPTIAMLALGALQGGILLALEAPFRRWLRNLTPWTATVLINGRIMTVYLWHLTAMIVVIGTAVLLGGVGLRLAPGSSTWWLSRPIWMAVLAVILIPLMLLFGRFERLAGPPRERATWQLILGATLVCAGVAMMALEGVAGGDVIGVRLWVVAMPFVGAALAGVVSLRSSRLV